MSEPSSQAGAVTLCVLLWARPGTEDGLIAYEDRVLGIATGHGGEVLQRARGSGAGERDRVIARTDVIDVELVRPDPG